jgi:hypothetical protein
MKLTGTLRHYDLEGGVWLLAVEGGRQYQLSPAPRGLSSGEAVEVEGDPDAGGVSFQMAAPIFRVRSIRRRG